MYVVVEILKTKTHTQAVNTRMFPIWKVAV